VIPLKNDEVIDLLTKNFRGLLYFATPCTYLDCDDNKFWLFFYTC